MRQHRQKIHTCLNWTAVFRVSSLFHDFLSSSSAPPFITFHHFDSLWYKCGVADAQKQKKSCVLPELLTNVVLDGGTGRLCSNTKISDGRSLYPQVMACYWSGSFLPPCNSTHGAAARPYGYNTELDMLLTVCCFVRGSCFADSFIGVFI